MLGPGPTYTKLAILDPLLVMKLARVLRSERVDVIHAHHYEGCLVAAAARVGTRVPPVFDVHTLLGSELQHYQLPLMPFRLKRAVAHALDRRLPRRADHVVTVTDRIRLHAGFTEIPGLLARADVAINPRTDCDGIPVKLLNYMAASKAVVSFAGSAPGLRHRETGWLAPDGNVEALADGTLGLIDDRPLASELGRNARRFVELRHSWTRSAAMTEEVYGAAISYRLSVRHPRLPLAGTDSR